MKKLKQAIATWICIFAFNCVFAAEPVSTPSDIREVTVYLNGAQVTRYATASLVAGENEIVFGGLSNFIDQNSISVSGGGNAVITSVRYEINYLKYQKKPDNITSLESERDTLGLKLEFVKNDISSLQKELDMLDENRKMGISPKTEFVPDLGDLAEYYHKQVLETSNKMSRLKIKEKDMTDKYNGLVNQINKYNYNTNIPSGEVIVHLSSTGYNNADFKISYYVQKAHWNPLYNIRAQNVNEPVKLDYNAMVFQQSGEDWNNVKLALSSGNPSLGGNKPELSQWFIDIYQPGMVYRKSTRYEEKAMNAPAPTMSSADMSGTQDMKTTADYTTVTQQQTATIFEINLKYDIPSDAQGRQVQVQQYSLPAQFVYSAVPKLDPDAFLLGSVTGWSDYNLLPGNANIFFEGAFVGKSLINPDQTGDSLPVSFGRDKRIVIQRTKVKDFSKKQFLGGSQTQSFTFTYSLKNTKNTAVTLKIQDQLPTSKTKDIEVNALDLSNGVLDPETGKITWTLTLQPGETQKYNFSYSVKYPKNKTVAGLN